MKLDAYIRVSDVGGREGDSFHSPETQLKAIRTYARAHGHKIIRVHEELDRSGADRKRPKWNEALDRVDAGATDGIIVAKLDRFARSLSAGVSAIERVNDAGGCVIAVKEGINTSDEDTNGKLWRGIIQVLAEWQRDRIKDEWADINAVTIARGRHNGPVAPSGYVRGDDGRLVLDPQVAPLVHQVFVRRARGESTTVLAAFLNEHGVTTSKGGAFTPSVVTKMLSNPAYKGEARFGRKLTNGDAHAPIVTAEEWAAANAGVRQVKRARGTSLLGGLIRCASCGYALVSHHSSKGHVYKCTGHHPAGECPQRASILGPVVDEYVSKVFLARVKGELAFELTGSTEELDAAQARVEDAHRKLTVYRDTALDILSAGDFADGLAVRQAELQKAREAVEELRAAGELAGLAARASTLEAEWGSLSVSEQRVLLDSLVELVVVRPVGRGSRVPVEDRVHVFWRADGDAPTGLPARGGNTGVTELRSLWPADRDVETGVPAS